MTATGSHSGSVRPDGAAVSAVSLLDRSSGEVRWGRPYARLLAWSVDREVLLGMVDGVGEIVAIDVAGVERWRRTRGTAELSGIVGELVAVTGAQATGGQVVGHGALPLLVLVQGMLEWSCVPTTRTDRCGGGTAGVRRVPAVVRNWVPRAPTGGSPCSHLRTRRATWS